MGNYKKFLYIITILISFVFIKEVNALNLDSYQFWAESKVITTNSFHTFDGGTGNNFNFALLGTVSDYITDGGDGADIYVKASVCMDPVIASQYANESKSQYDISNFQMYQTKTKCNFTGSSYTGGRIVDTYFKIWVSDSTDSFSAYWVVYPIMNFSIELISVEVNTTGFKIDYSSDTIIEQNETLIIQGATSIEYQKDSYKQQVETNEKLDGINDSITSEEAPNVDGLSNDAIVGWLPAGPIDSILNLPLSMMTNLSNSIGSTCEPVDLPLPYVDKTLTLPCLSNIYSQIDGLSAFLNTIGTILSAFILYSYFMKLYKWVDDTLTFRENNHIENWGGL